MAAAEVGGTPSPHDSRSLVSFLDHDTGTVTVFDTLTGEPVDGDILNFNTSKKSGSPTSVAFFDESEAKEAILPVLFPSITMSLTLSPELSASALPIIATTNSACMASTTISPTYNTTAELCVISSANVEVTNPLCSLHIQEILPYCKPTADCGSDPPNLIIAPSFFSYWFDGFAYFQCFCVLIILFVWFDGIALNKSYSLDLVCSTAGLRIAKSVRPNLSNIQGDTDQCASGLEFSARPFPSITFASGAAVDPDLLILPFFLPPLDAPLNFA